jgi:ADP-ribose pyrophosphatase YjhB (NUDIX family)
MSLLDAHGDWARDLHARAMQPPRRPRLPLWWEGVAIGSVETGVLERLAPEQASDGGPLLQKFVRAGTPGWELQGELTRSLAQVAAAFRSHGIAHAWRDEQLAVSGVDGRVLGTVERAVVRPLGITTCAVHLVGRAADGSHWVQQRSFSKPDDPGLWDTLMGGMVPAGDSLAQALARETWEEAGLRIDQLQGLEAGGRVTTQRPSGDGEGCGYVIENIDWYRCVLPDGVMPQNQDGEVEQFRRMQTAELVQRLVDEEFTLEAALILVQAGV